MNKLLAGSAAHFAGAAALRPVSGSEMIANNNEMPVSAMRNMAPVDARLVSMPTAPLPASLPLMSSQSGNLFVDRNNAGIHWYLPDFALADDVDPAFAFAASQSGQDSQGNPFSVAQVTMLIRKFRPDDASQFVQANPTATLQEIPLSEMTSVMSSSYTDSNGQTQQRTFNAASVQDMGDGSFMLTFNGSILGDSVIGLYQDLRVYGKAIVNFSASYQAWVEQGEAFIPRIFSMNAMNLVAPNLAVAAAPVRPAATTAAIAPVSNVATAARFAQMRSFAPALAAGASVAQTQPEQPTLIQARQSFGKALPLGLKYNADGYQLKYTVSTAAIQNHVIVSVDDLKDFNGSQSEFEQLMALGDLSQKYPTISCAYFGVLSRSIVVIPQRYCIVRSKAGCAAVCMALVDSAASSASKCKFEFDFSIAPEVSPIEMQKLQNEISNNADLKGSNITFPNFLKDTPASTLLTGFTSSVQFAAGADANTFALTVSIQDDSSGIPSVGNANLFIDQLCSLTGPDLLGSLNIKLDDGYPNPISAPVDLNFMRTSGTDELAFEFDQTDSQIKLTNQSPLDLTISDYALTQGSAITEFPGVFTIAAGGITTLPLASNSTSMGFVADAQLAIPSPFTKSDVTDFLNFKTVDVEETSDVVSVDGSGVDYTRVDSIVVSITFTSLPSVAPRALNLSKNITSDSTQVVIPLENAMFALPATANITAHFIDASIADLTFTMQNDFIANPVLVLIQSDIDNNLPKA